MKGKIFFILFFLCPVFLPVQVFPADETAAQEQITAVDEAFLAGAASVSPMERDRVLEDLLHKKISGSGTVLSFDKTRRYGRSIRLLLSAPETSGEKLSVIYSIFLDNEAAASMLVTGDEFSFTGKTEAVTPCSTGRTVYMLDVIPDGGGNTEKDK